jgi:lipoprotein NlpI
MNLFELIYADDAVSLACLIAIFFIVGRNMADDTVRRWGWRAASLCYVVFVMYACETVGPTGAADLAYIAFRGLFAGGLTVGTAWMVLAIVLFFIREMQQVDDRIRPATSQSERREPDESDRQQTSDRPTDWKPNVRDFSKLPPEARKKFQERRRVTNVYEEEARRLLEKLQTPVAPNPTPPTVVERRRLETQLDELELARQFITVSREDPQEIGRMLAECNAKIVSLKQAVGRIPADPLGPTEPPQLAGIAIIDEAIARRPDNPTLYVERAKHLISQERLYKKAIAYCNYALNLHPTYYAAFNIRGLAHHHLGKYSAAVRDFERAIYENPPYDWAYVNLATTYNATGSYREALGPAYDASFTNPEGYHQLAIAYEHLSEREKAVHHLTMVIQCDPNGEHVPDARVRRAKQLQQLGRPQLAMHDLKTHLARKPDAAARQLLAQLERLSAFSPQATDTIASHDAHAEAPAIQLSNLDT